MQFNIITAQPSRTLRPSRKSFQNAKWLPKSQEAFYNYMDKLSKKVEKRRKLIRDKDNAFL